MDRERTCIPDRVDRPTPSATDNLEASKISSLKQLQEMLGTKVHLFLFVKVRENWSDDRERYREMGLDFPEK